MKKLAMMLLLASTLVFTACGGKGKAPEKEPVQTESEAKGSTEAQTEAEPQTEAQSESEAESEIETVVQVQEPAESTGLVAKALTNVRVRKSPSLEADALGMITGGDYIEIIEEGAEWTAVNYHGMIAYVASQYLSKAEAAEQAAEASSEAQENPSEEEPETPAASENEKPKPAGGNGKVVCIDPGHQAKGNNEKEPVGPGSKEMKKKTSSGTAGFYTKVAEYKLTLEIGLQLQEELEKRGYTVVMTRTTHDVNISNVERANMANEANADCFIRIHADGSESHDAHGTFTICMTPKSPYNSNIYTESRLLSDCLVDEICALTGSKNKGVMESNAYSGINWSKVPVTILEMGYMTNKEEDYAMQDPAYQSKIVQGIANGVDKYIAEVNQ